MPLVADLLRVSLVTYYPDVPTLRRTLFSLDRALSLLYAVRKSGPVELCVINNGGSFDKALVSECIKAPVVVRVIRPEGNLGFGQGHNLSFAPGPRYHLILNPDVEQADDALVQAIGWMEAHPEVVMLAPEITDGKGERSYLCRRRPTPWVLGLRAFAPAFLQRLFARSLAHYEMRDRIDGRSDYWDPPLISGCYMFCRNDALQAAGGFDPGYFLYFEDYDLSLRMARLGRLAYVPAVSITHFGGGAARKGWRHIRLFVRSAWRFFTTHGWSG